MQVLGRKRKTEDEFQDSKRKRLSMYSDLPYEEISLPEFESLALKRLHVLRELEKITINVKASQLPQHTQLAKDIQNLCAKNQLNDPRKDQISHFILRLGFCQSEENRRWFLQRESDLLRFRLEAEEVDKKGFLAEAGIQFEPVTLDDELRTKILQSLHQKTRSADTEEVYRIPFEDAIDSIRIKRVYLQGGWAYVTRSHFVSIIILKFRSHLSQQLAELKRVMANLKKDKRISGFVANFTSTQTEKAYSTWFAGAITREQIPMLAERSFPLCMNHLYKSLIFEGHLKHGGRMQLGLFLKAIGLSLEDSLAIWKAAFSKKTPGDKFDRQYAYNIRHNYGKEGKRTSYTPFGCLKIIMSQPGAEERSGCPFRHLNPKQLQEKLYREKKLTDVQITEIMKLVANNHYQIACQRLFEFTHPAGPGARDTVSSHPNTYFDASMAYYREKEEGGKAKEHPVDDVMADFDPDAYQPSEASSEASSSPSSSSSSSSSEA